MCLVYYWAFIWMVIVARQSGRIVPCGVHLPVEGLEYSNRVYDKETDIALAR